MKKRLLSLFVVAVMVCSSFVGAYADAKPVANEIKPFLGGGDSHHYRISRKYYKNNVSYDEIRRLYNKMDRERDQREKGLALLSFAWGFIPKVGWIPISALVSANNKSLDQLERVVRYGNTNDYYSIYFYEYTSEVPNSTYVEIQNIKANVFRV